MDSKTNKAKKSTVTTPKLIAIGVLAVILVGVLYLQYGPSGSAKPAAAASSAARERPAARKPRSRSTKDEPLPAAGVRKTMGNLNRWQPPDLSIVVEYDPFALPAAFPKPPTAEETATLVSNGPDTPESLAKEQAAIAQERQRMQQQYDALRKQGVKVLVKDQGEYVAVIGDQEIRVGDEINGFTVTSINSDGVQIAWQGN